jgi:hypothetical protein
MRESAGEPIEKHVNGRCTAELCLSQPEARETIRVLDPVPCFDLLNLGLRRLPNKLLPHPRFTADQIQEALDCRISRNGATTIVTVTGSCGKRCGMINSLDKSKYRRTPQHDHGTIALLWNQRFPYSP